LRGKRVYFEGKWLDLDEVERRLGRGPIGSKSSKLLRLLLDARSPISIQELARRMDLSFKSTYRTVIYLERKGYVARVGRFKGVLVGLTQEGYSKISKDTR